VLRDLVYIIGRKFYDAPAIIILDALTYFTAIKDTQLEAFLKIPIKELSRPIALLRDHKLIKV
jgi:transcription initiation factor IIE alpha subunit